MEETAVEMPEVPVEPVAPKAPAPPVVAPVVAPVAPVVPAVEKVTLRHPLTQDTKVVNATPEEMIPLMGRGYSQVKGA